MAKVTVRDRVGEMVRDVVAPGLKAHGFHRRGLVFWRESPDGVCHVAALALDRWGSAERSLVGVKLGVFWNAVEAMLANPSFGKVPPPDFRCTFRIDLGSAISEPPKPPWEVSLDSDYGEIGQTMLGDLVAHGLPWLAYRSELGKALEWKRYSFSQDGGLHTRRETVSADALVVFKTLLGKRVSALADLRRFARNGFGDEAVALAGRLGLESPLAARTRRAGGKS